MELRQSSDYARYMEAIGWITAKDPQTGTVAFIRQILPYCSVMKIQRAPVGGINSRFVRSVAKKYHAWGCYVEPEETAEDLAGQEAEKWNELKRTLKMSEVKNGMLPTATRRLDITLSKQELLAGMKEKTRYNLGLAERRGVQSLVLDGATVAHSPTLFATFMAVLDKNAKRVGYWGMPKQWLLAQLTAFGSRSLVIATAEAAAIKRLHTNHEIDSAALQTVVCFWTTTDGIFYGPNGSSESGRKNMAPTLAVWAGIQEGKRRKLKYLDFDGIFDERVPNKRWLGYSRFKAGFGGAARYFALSGYSWFPCL